MPLAVFAALLVLWQLVLWIFHVPPYMLPSPLGGGARCRSRRFPSLLASLRHHSGRIRRRPDRQHRRGRADRADFRAIALGAQHVLSLHAAAADGADRRHCAADPDVGRRGHGWPSTLIAFIISLAPIIANTTQGLISVDENLVHLFLMHNASPAQMLFKLRLPHAVPSLFVASASPAASR